MKGANSVRTATTATNLAPRKNTVGVEDAGI
jgi:hypothetical protein